MNALSIFSGLLDNALILLALTVAQWVTVRYFRPGRRIEQCATGLLLGASAIAVMLTPVALQPGVIFDARTVVLSIGALFGGPPVALIAGAMAAAYRLWLGGAGVLVGLATILVAVLAGLAWRHWRSGKQSGGLRPWDFVGLGLVVNLLSIGLFSLLPLARDGTDLPSLMAVFVAVMTLATLFLGLVTREIEKSHRFDTILAASEDRFARLFQHAAVSIWEEDISRVWRHLDRLRANGVIDLRAHLRAHPGLARRLAAEVRVLKVNSVSLSLFGAMRERDLTSRIDRLWAPATERTFIDGLCAVWAGAARFSAETEMRTLGGAPLSVVLSFPVPQNEADARQIPVCIADITRRREAERHVAQERQRLQEILRGTHIGTWEWNVQTGETRFNARWAEIAGYTLEELAPVSIETWAELCHPDDLARSNALLQRVFARESEYYDFEARMRHKAGHWVWVQDRGTVVEWDNKGHPLRMSGTHADITDRKHAEQRLARSGAMRSAILRCQAALLEAKGEEAMLQETCGILVEASGYSLAWIGLSEQGPLPVLRPVAQAGGRAGDAAQLAMLRADTMDENGPVARALQSGKAEVRNRLDLVAPATHWAVTARDLGMSAVVAAPLAGPQGVAAVLCVYSSVPEGFDAEEVALLSDFAGNLALVLQNSRTTRENQEIGAALARSAMTAVNAIAKTIEKRDPYTSGHQERVAALSAAIGRKLGWDPHRIEGLRLGATIHDIGKIYVPAEILNRPGKLTENEMALIRSHAAIGGEILAETQFPWPIREMVEQHHERLDGSGYPHGLTDEQILPEAKVLAVADLVEAMSSHRPYRPARSIEDALAEILRGRGTIYDPATVDACISVIRDDGFRSDRAAA